MPQVQTVTGAIEAELLGRTLAHEHLALRSPGMQQQYPWLYDRAVEIDHIADELAEAREAGIGTIVDVTTVDLGRDVERAREISERAGVQVVACTGVWVDIPKWFDGAGVEEIADLFVREIDQGIDGTSIRAGVIKVANNEPDLSETEEKILRGAALAAARTGVPVTTHTRGPEVGRAQMRIFASEDAPAHLFAIGHSFTDDVSYLREVLDAGHYLSVDMFKALREEEEPGVLRALATLCEERRAERVMLSHDHVPEHFYRAEHEPHLSPSGYTYVSAHVCPALLALGVPQPAVDAMLVTAPARFLTAQHDSIE